MINHFTKGIDPKYPMTRSWRIWLEYFCWCVNTALPFGVMWPMWVRIFTLRRFGKHFVFVPILNPALQRLKSWFRHHTGGRSHRCEFTDKNHGALYGHSEGAFMDRYFEKFIQNISRDLEVQDYLEEQAEGWRN